MNFFKVLYDITILIDLYEGLWILKTDVGNIVKIFHPGMNQQISSHDITYEALKSSSNLGRSL